VTVTEVCYTTINVGRLPVYYWVKVASTTLPISVLCLPQTVDCGGGLVNIWGLGCLCRIMFNSILLWLNINWLFSLRQQILG